MKNVTCSLGRKFVLLFSTYVLLAAMALVAWVSWTERRDSLDELHEMAQGNSAVLNELRLPGSSELATRLSRILGMDVGFIENGDIRGTPSGELATMLIRMDRARPSGSMRLNGYEVGYAPMGNSLMSLVLVRSGELRWGQTVLRSLVPVSVITLAGLLVAALAAGGIVRPLRRMTELTPRLEDESEGRATSWPEDITSRSDEIGVLARALEKTAKTLHAEQEWRRRTERLAALGRIATSLAHEVRNPAAAIGLHADLLLAEPRTNSEGSLLLIREEVDRITDLVNQWLFVAKPSSSTRSKHDLRSLLEKVVRRMEPMLHHAEAEVRWVIPDRASLMVFVDGPRLEQVFRNLLMNAAQAMPEGGVILIEISLGNGILDVAINDSGPGFSEAARRHFGEPFFSEREGGMGIGLTLAREVLQGLGGSIRVETASNGGGRVICTLDLWPGLAHAGEE
jgi:signal transduction histidine kinase